MDPHFAFEDSRRLPGSNRWFAGPAVVLTALGDGDPERWSHHVRSICKALHWPDPAPTPHRHASGLFLVFTAPEQALFTATEINEWAWEQSLHSDGAFVIAHALPEPVATFAERARRERSRPLQRLDRKSVV